MGTQPHSPGEGPESQGEAPPGSGLSLLRQEAPGRVTPAADSPAASEAGRAVIFPFSWDRSWDTRMPVSTPVKGHLPSIPTTSGNALTSSADWVLETSRKAFRGSFHPALQVGTVISPVLQMRKLKPERPRDWVQVRHPVSGAGRTGGSRAAPGPPGRRTLWPPRTWGFLGGEPAGPSVSLTPQRAYPLS